MNNDTENFVPEIDTSIILPCDAVHDSQPNHVSVDEMATRLNIDEATLCHIKQLLPEGTTTITDGLLRALTLAVHHDEDVSNAEAQGYVRGRNENIEAQCGFDHPQGSDDITVEEVYFPRYTRRSVWD